MLDPLTSATKPPRRADSVRREAHGSLILDLFGVVRFCSRDFARLVRCDPSDLSGRAVRSLLPDLAFSERTPGYNISLAKVLFAQGEWCPLRLACESCENLLVDAALESIEIQGRRLFHLDLRWPSRQSAAPVIPALTSHG